MFFQKNSEPEIVEIKGHQLVCPVCGNKYFERKVTVYSNMWRFFRPSVCYICSECDHIFWFKRQTWL